MPCAAFEIKQCQTSLPFVAVAEHQIDALLAVKSKQGLLYKAPDDSRSVKPFDLFYMRSALAYVVIKYPSYFHIIDVDTFLLEKQRSKRKSLTQQRAGEIAVISVRV